MVLLITENHVNYYKNAKIYTGKPRYIALQEEDNGVILCRFLSTEEKVNYKTASYIKKINQKTQYEPCIILGKETSINNCDILVSNYRKMAKTLNKALGRAVLDGI